MSVAKFPMSMLSSRISRNSHVLAGQITRSVNFRYRIQPPPESPRSWPPKPPNQKFMDILRTRGLRSPPTVTKERSAGHFQIPVLLPQYGQRGLFLMSTSTSQFERLLLLKFISPFTQT